MPSDASTALLTGYPSFVARRMAEQILREENNTLLYCVVKNKLAALAEEMASALPASQRSRLVMMEGDAAAMDLGLSGAEFREVSSRIDRIFQFAQVTYVDADPKLAHYVNVDGAREALELARSSPRLRNLICLSSAAVSGARTGLVRESDPPAGPPYRTIIEETLAHGERILRRAAHRVPLTLLRPSIVIGDSQTGEVDRFDGPYPLILLLLNSPANTAVPLPVQGDLPLNLVPVDFLIRAAHAIGSSPDSVGRTFHIVDPAPLSSRRVFELIAHAAGRRSPRGFVPSYLARSMIHAPGIERVVKSPRAFLELLTVDVRFDTKNTSEILRGTGITCPPFESYVDQIVGYVQSRIRERRRKHDVEAQFADDPLS
jgi:nucleoside-diphosphate-sugar epimerase